MDRPPGDGDCLGERKAAAHGAGWASCFACASFALLHMMGSGLQGITLSPALSSCGPLLIENPFDMPPLTERLGRGGQVQEAEG